MRARPFLLIGVLGLTAAVCGVSFVRDLDEWRFPRERLVLATNGAAAVLAAVAIFLPGRARPALALVVGVVAYVVTVRHPRFVHDTFGDPLYVLVPALLLLPVGLVDRARHPDRLGGAVAATVGILGILAVWLVPDDGRLLARSLLIGLGDGDLSTLMTAYYIWFALAPIGALLALTVWWHGARRVLPVLAAFFVVWLPGWWWLSVFTSLVGVHGWDWTYLRLANVDPAIALAFLGALAALAPTELRRART